MLFELAAGPCSARESCTKRPALEFSQAIGNRLGITEERRRRMAGTKMGVVGCGGRMGRMLVAEIVASEGCALAGGCAKPGTGYINQDIGELAGVGRLGISVGDDAEKLIRDSDVVIEFTTPAATAAHAAQAVGLGKPIVIGTTGLSAEEGAAVREAGRKVPIVWAPNMSLGINLLLGVV